jgi:hypothetical protein
MGQVIELHPATEKDETPEQVGKAKVLKIKTVGDKSSSKPKEG